jgi:hypothetical protein
MLNYLDQTQAYTGASFSIWEKMEDGNPGAFKIGNEINAPPLRFWIEPNRRDGALIFTIRVRPRTLDSVQLHFTHDAG